MSKSIYLITIGQKDYYYNGKQFFYKKRLGKNRYSKLTPIKSISLVRTLLKKI